MQISNECCGHRLAWQKMIALYPLMLTIHMIPSTKHYFSLSKSYCCYYERKRINHFHNEARSETFWTPYVLVSYLKAIF